MKNYNNCEETLDTFKAYIIIDTHATNMYSKDDNNHLYKMSTLIWKQPRNMQKITLVLVMLYTTAMLVVSCKENPLLTLFIH